MKMRVGHALGRKILVKILFIELINDVWTEVDTAEIDLS